MLPMTVKTYLDHYNCLSHLRYEIIDAHHIAIQNTEDACKGFTLVCPAPIRFEDHRFYDYRKVGDGYYVWFDLKPWERVIILINE